MAYTYSQLEGFWTSAGGDPKVAPIMAAIALAESAGTNVIQKGQPYSTTGWGLWQITPGNSVPHVGVDRALLDPLTNAKAAVVKYKSQGLRAWTTYTDGSYKQFYKGGVAPEKTAQARPADAWDWIFDNPVANVLAFPAEIIKVFKEISSLLDWYIKHKMKFYFIVAGSTVSLIGLVLFARDSQ